MVVVLYHELESLGLAWMHWRAHASWGRELAAIDCVGSMLTLKASMAPMVCHRHTLPMASLCKGRPLNGVLIQESMGGSCLVTYSCRVLVEGAWGCGSWDAAMLVETTHFKKQEIWCSISMQQ